MKLPYIFILILIIIFLLILYLKYPKIYKLLFNNPLGYIFAILLIGLFYYLNVKLGLYFGFIYSLLFLLSNIIITEKEGFNFKDNRKWSKETIDNFLKFQKIYNPTFNFDIDMIQTQASENEVKILLETGAWPWSEQIQKLFMDYIKRNPIIKTSPEKALNNARTIYNETIIKRLMSYNTPEGDFLLRGIYLENTKPNNNIENSSGDYGKNSGLISNELGNNIIRCGINKYGEPEMQKIIPFIYDGTTISSSPSKIEKLDYNELPKLINGFHFINNNKKNNNCDPCIALKSQPDYSCAFSLNNEEPSNIWKILWNLN